MRSTNHSPLDSTGSAAESTISSAVNDESNHAISNTDNALKEISGKDSDDGSNTILNENSPDEVVKPSAIDASSTNEDDDSGKKQKKIIMKFPFSFQFHLWWPNTNFIFS